LIAGYLTAQMGKWLSDLIIIHSLYFSFIDFEFTKRNIEKQCEGKKPKVLIYIIRLLLSQYWQESFCT
jgi:hypothetical protein